MRPRRTRYEIGALVALVAAAPCLSSGCESRQCGAVSAASYVQVDLKYRWQLVELCVDGQCGSIAMVGVGDQPADHTFRLTAIDPTGATVVREGTVRTKQHNENGPGCPPTTANAWIEVAYDGSITFRY